jgi:hypothetical protein
LRVRANAHTIADADSCAADAYRVVRHAYKLAANRHTNHRTADTHRVICYSYKPIANHGAIDGGS